MPLSFSIDAILGRPANKTPDNNKCESINGNHDEVRRMHEGQRASMTKEDEYSPRSHTIEWKPYGRESTFSKTVTPQQRNELVRKYSVDGSKLLLRSPPNASVIPAYGKCDRMTKDSGLRQTIKDISPMKMKNFKPTQIHPGVSQLFPYSMEFLQNRGVNHHPHHYPYRLPFVSHGCSLQSQSFPGLFSPNYSAQNMEDKAGKDKSEYANSGLSECSRVTQLSGETCGSNAPPVTTATTQSGTESVETEQLKVSHSNDEQSSSDNEMRIPDQIPAKKKRIGRRLFTGFQILELEKAFAIKPYLNRMERAFISQKVNLTECQIKTWFQNRRTKEKRRGIGSEEDGGKSGGVFSDTIVGSYTKPSHIPGYGIQLVPTYGPPDHHLQAAIVNYFSRRKSPESMRSNVDL